MSDAKDAVDLNNKDTSAVVHSDTALIIIVSMLTLLCFAAVSFGFPGKQRLAGPHGALAVVQQAHPKS